MAYHMDMMISEVKVAPNSDEEEALKKTYSEAFEVGLGRCTKEGKTEHLRTAPYHPQSNGLAERFVDTLKRGIKKLKREEKPSEATLNVILQAYRSTPNESLSNRTPAEVFLGRKLQTRMSLLSPIENTPKSSTVSGSPNKMKEQFDRRNRVTPKEFKSGDVVYAQIWKAPNFVWKTGTIVRRLGRVNYEVEVEGKLMRKHANQLRRSNAKTNTGDRPLETLLEVLELDDLLKRKDKAFDCESDANTALPCSPKPQLRRSTRTRRPVQRYGCEPLVDVVKHK
ncbi:hypothetical protein TELCIR_23353 [Teladorsagia circumcincta]|uniref:Integrase catalytic domain-containing protein n=1 Tax=Teladorsagia circumcincta TaxID=45464 RepID=A0A2G9TCK1_TELCI|nr:hypothetical protein TELCIR_23353 [Teladorsagia circumcincta]